MADLSGFNVDLKQIDLNKILGKLLDQKTLFAILLVVLAALAAALMLFKDYSVRVNHLQQQNKQVSHKVDVIKDHDTSAQKLNAFSSSLPKSLTGEMFINQLSDYAAQNQVEILNITPGATKKEDFYNVTSVHLNATANSFKNMLLFLKTIETSPYALRVDSWSGQLQESNNSSSVNCEMDIASIEVKT